MTIEKNGKPAMKVSYSVPLKSNNTPKIFTAPFKRNTDIHPASAFARAL